MDTPRKICCANPPHPPAPRTHPTIIGGNERLLIPDLPASPRTLAIYLCYLSRIFHFRPGDVIARPPE
jgi:hypothetical protein